MLLSIETSCDEAACAVLDPARADARDFVTSGALVAELISSQAKLHETYGGVVPELAAREHLTNLPTVVSQVMRQAQTSFDKLTAVAVTKGPGLKGCLLVGLCYAKALAYALKVPLVTLNHMEGHLFGVELMEQAVRIRYPALALIVSGGHTMLVHIKGFRSYEIVARTRDDAAGEAFDKAATLLGLPYPGGPSLAKRAALGAPDRFKFPFALPKEPQSFSFSGLKTAISRTVKQHEQALENDPALVNDLAASAQEAIVHQLLEKTAFACDMLRPQMLILAGGVAANERLRAALSERASRAGVAFSVPSARWCTDNAAMLGVLALRIMQSKPERFRDWRPAPGEELGPGVGFADSALPRWPIDTITPS